MSVLVYDGKSIGTDSLANNGEVSFPFGKLWYMASTNGNSLLGAIGPLQAVGALRQWSDQGFRPTQFPTAMVNGTPAQLVVLTKEKGLVRYNKSPVPLLHGYEKLAIGEGAPWATAALEMGASAEEAVRIAIKYCVHCNGEPVVLSL